MNKRIITFILALAVRGGASAQQKQSGAAAAPIRTIGVRWTVGMVNSDTGALISKSKPYEQLEKE